MAKKKTILITSKKDKVEVDVKRKKGKKKKPAKPDKINGLYTWD